MDSPPLSRWDLPNGEAQRKSSPEEHLGELARFFGYSHDLLAVLDGRGRVLHLSPSTERILGYPPDTLNGRRLLDLVHPDEVAHVRDLLRPLTVETAVSDLDCRVLHLDGRWIAMRWSVSAQGPQSRIYGVGRDREVEVRRANEARKRETAELRLRTAAELHDGVLQTLTATTLQLEVARRLLDTDPAAAASVLATLREAVSAEQQELRLYVDELKIDQPVGTDRPVTLGRRIAAMLDRISAIWGVETRLQEALGDPLDPEVERQVFRIIQEAVVNAARHGHARTVSVDVVHDGQQVTIHLQDDGLGFPFLGKFEDQELKDRRIGPLSLKRRVTRTGGLISIRSTPEGASLHITLPSVPSVQA